ncbi:Exopolysaccharide synthesis ExoD [[Leptolyngbya] sp. PCC 7376]|uniref:exopolysaccharide biosynthesis protein n=1 Tax=[Leptolyngbya] sp. PCC 7376 TaxID=111781 RepID=UPI00029EEA96|nr:exopolysaccharide biosynthesis protein [[Leptolyngbya] sp. PCC 7376]AFY37781.1 Exopolysaccharide synthesis ExoD [[Leptolyngbya] sp. PCC 7376]
MARLSKELTRYFFEEDRGETVSLAQVIALAEEKVFGIVLLLLAFPSALPVPAPGYSTPFGIIIFLIAGQLVIGRQSLLLPISWQRKTIQTEKIRGILKKGLPWLQKVEAIAHPRLPMVCQTQVGRMMMGCTICLMAISMSIPIPGTNTLPAISVFLTAFGLQEDDGLISAAGMVLSILIAVLMASVIYVFFNGGLSLIDIVKDWIKP